MLAHVGNLTADPGTEVAHGKLAMSERFEDTQALRVRERPTNRGVPRPFGLGGDRQAFQHVVNDINCCANTQVSRGVGTSISHGILAAMPDAPEHVVTLAEIEAARERLAGRVHRTQMMTSTTAAAWLYAASGVGWPATG
jgi:hypothetical protein